MRNYKVHGILFFSLLIYCIAWIVLHPFLGYMLDSDGIAYLTITKRLLNHQYLESINGLWSPLNSWLMLPFIQQGCDLWLLAKVLNCFFGAFVIVLSHLLFIRFKMSHFAHSLLLPALSIVMVHNVYLQMFGDVLQLIIVLLYLMLLFSKKFTTNYASAILCGVIMALGFYAKAYTFFFFLLHFGLSLFWYYHHNLLSVKRAINYYILGCLTIIMILIPWSIALHQKYGEWTLTGFSGKMNMSWQLNSGKSFRPDVKLLIPPSDEHSPSFWEDPYPTQVNLSTPFSSGKHFIKWIARIIHTTLTSVGCFNEISCLSFMILLIGFYFFFFVKKKIAEDSIELKMQLLLLTVISLPAGYLMMHIETRYIWLNIILLMIIGAILLEKFSALTNALIYKISICLLAFSFVIFPILNIESLKFKNKDLFQQADQLNKHRIKGSFTSNTIDAGRMWVIAYLTNNPFYTIERTDYSGNELMNELKRYHVKYFLYSSENNKLLFTSEDKNFKFLFKAEGFDLYEVTSSN